MTHGHRHERRDEHAGLWRGGDDLRRPIIGIAPDVVEPRPGSVRAQCAIAYSEAVIAAGGVPFVLPPIVEQIPLLVSRCDGIVLTGGDDPRTEPFGKPTHAKATPVHELRQRFDTALIQMLLRRTEVPTLGVCLGMQMMALVSGGELDQHLPETTPTADRHAGNALHPVIAAGSGPMPIAVAGMVTSHHRQAVRSAGAMDVIGLAEDGVIEAIARRGVPFFVGVQWHPERTQEHAVGVGVFERLVEHARARTEADRTKAARGGGPGTKDA